MLYNFSRIYGSYSLADASVLYQPDVDAEQLVLCALESTYAALAIMTHQDMPKQLYKEEVCAYPLISVLLFIR